MAWRAIGIGAAVLAGAGMLLVAWSGGRAQTEAEREALVASIERMLEMPYPIRGGDPDGEYDEWMRTEAEIDGCVIRMVRRASFTCTPDDPRRPGGTVVIDLREVDRIRHVGQTIPAYRRPAANLSFVHEDHVADALEAMDEIARNRRRSHSPEEAERFLSNRGVVYRDIIEGCREPFFDDRPLPHMYFFSHEAEELPSALRLLRLDCAIRGRMGE